MATDSERHIIISVDLEANPGRMSIDVGTLTPHIAYAVLHQALEVLESMGAYCTVVHNGHVVEDTPEEMI